MMTGATLRLAWRYLVHRRFASIVSVLAIALSLVFVVGVGVVNFAVKKTAVDGSIRYPLIVGPAGASGVQVILSTIFHIDKPSGLVDYAVYEALKADPRVVAAYPLAVADTYRHIRIVGVNQAYLDDLAVGAHQGKIDLSEVSNAVVGFSAAQRAGLAPGDTFYGQHGMVGSADAHEHRELAYTVVGILNPGGGPEDNAIYTSYRAVWAIHSGQSDNAHDHDHDHDHHDCAFHAHGAHAHQETADGQDKYALSTHSLTAVLVRTANPAYTGMLEREYSLREGTLAVDTARTIRSFVAHVNKGEAFVEVVSTGMLAIALALILVTLVMSLNERRRELALLRMLGVRRLTLALTVMVEALALTLLGALVGLGAGHALAWLAQDAIRNAVGVTIEPFTVTRLELTGLWVTLLAGQLLALVAMLFTYRMNLLEEVARD